MNTYALDFESFYSAECSITTLGPRGYFSHPDFEAYMVTIVGDDGYTYAGHPRDFDWSILNGHRVLSHNASFDESLYLYGVEQGWFPSCAPAEWHCTADMCAFLGLPRALKNASATVFGLEVDKSVRDNMKGKQWGSMTPEFRAEVTAYAIKDSELCLRLWQEKSEGWPTHEREISRVNRKIGQRGLPMDAALLKKNLEVVKMALFDAEQAIPWMKDYTPLSRKAFNEQCRKQGITPPSSLAQDSEEADKWFSEHQKACPWARAVQSYRRINAFLKKLESFDAGTMPDGRYYGGLMYFGSTTGRFSGSGGNANLQNLPREEMFGVDFRSMIRPAAGRKLVVIDLAQIEVRTLCWLAGDTKAMQLIRETDDIYHAFGVLLGLHDPANGPLKEYDKALRQKVKSIVLGCGYGMGADRFGEFSGLEAAEAVEAVAVYRDRMKKVIGLWDSYKEHMAMTQSLGEPFEIDLPSGRSLKYGKLRRMRDEKTGRFQYIGKLVRHGQLRDFRLWGGICTENAGQGLARDIFSDMMLRIEAAGHRIILHVHDEVVIECAEEEAEKVLAECIEIMSTPPAWILDIPLAAEGSVLDFYSK